MRKMRLLLLLSVMLLDAYAFTDENDGQALMKFKSQVSEDKRVVLSSWNNSLPVCNWTGVTCGQKHKRVTRLDLGGLQLGGVISPSIGNLSFLVYLNLADNSFGGTIPQEVGDLFRLKHLYMSLNVLRGGIPDSLSNCSRLLRLILHKNQLGGVVPSKLGSLTKLVMLNLGGNNLKRNFPAFIGNLTSLRRVSFADNSMEGEIPENIGRATRMTDLAISLNNFSGVFPPAIYNMSSLEYFYIFSNGFSGSLRPDFGDLLPNLHLLSMGANYLTGAIPISLANISTLQRLGMELNIFTGSISPNFGKVRNLQTLFLHSNSLGNYAFGDLEFVAALTNCTRLHELYVSENRLGGDLPASIANLSTKLKFLGLERNLISGSIPQDIGNLRGLLSLTLGKNVLTGSLPTSLGKLSSLGELSLDSNRMSGEIPSSLGNITLLETLDLFNNSFEGEIPPSLGACSHLLHLSIGYNKLNGTIPPQVMQISSLLTLTMPRNFLSGSLPNDVGRLEHVVNLNVWGNKLSGRLPKSLGNCLSMEKLYLQDNSFGGDIPDISSLVGIKRIDLSNNQFSGSIPEYLANFSKLEYLNLSVNGFEGRVPAQGIFHNSTIVIVYGNKHLCGGIRELKLKPCLTQAPPVEKKHFFLPRRVVIGVSVGIALLLLLFVASVSILWFRKRKRNQQTNNSTPSTLEVFHERISYGDLQTATNGFSTNNLIGSGSFGNVFKALLPGENNVVAVKVINMQRHGAMKSFMAECESLKDIKHRNLVKLLTACSSIDFQGNEFRALVYEFMPNGSLDAWLHPEDFEETRRPSRTLTLHERLNIAVDVASVLDYLHFHCHEPIVHCDLKPSNVLLDDDLTAHVSDFGLARLLFKFDQESSFNQLSSANVRGTLGYAAPEYGMGGQPSIQGDVYSFGVLLLEMFTGKRPTSELFGGETTLHSYTKSLLPDRVLDIVDGSILHSGLRVGFPAAECLTLVLEVALLCCEESPTNRLATSEATKELISIRERFFKARRRTRY